jgi:tetratricopeptide (TPR) repeat protein
MEELPERFKRLRKQRGFTSSLLAQPRYSVSYVSQIERGIRRPSRMALEFFAWRLGVSPEYLRTGVPDDLPLRLRFRLEEAEANLSEGAFAEARERAEGVLADTETYDVASIRRWAHLIQADAMFGVGEFTQAREVYELLLDQDGLGRSHRVRATVGVGRASRAVSDLRYAALVVEGFLEAEHDPPLDAASVADLQSVLVSVYFERGDVQLAQRAAERALAAIDETVPIRTQAVARNSAARVLVERGQLEEALGLMHEARTLMQTLHNRTDMAKHETAYAFLCLEVSPPQAEDALRHLNRAERLLRQVGGGPDLAYVYTERGRAAFLRGDHEEAAGWAERAARTEGVYVLEKGRALYLRGRALRALGRLAEASESLREALAIFEVNEARQQALLCWTELGEVAMQEGDQTAAVEAFRSGVALAGAAKPSLIF